MVLEGAGDCRHAVESGSLGELQTDLEIRIHPGLNPPEQLEDQPVAVNDRGVALFNAHARDRRVLSRVASSCRKRRRLDRANRSAPGRRGLLTLERVKERSHVAVVEPPVEEHTLPGAGDVGENRVRRVLGQAPDIRRGANRQRQKVVVPMPLVEFDFDYRHEQRLRRPSQQSPVDETGAADSTRLAGEPALTLQERDEQIPLDERAHVAVEQRFPRGADQKRWRFRDIRRRLRQRSRRHGRRRLLDLEPVERVRAQRQEIRVIADFRKLGEAEHFDRRHPLELGEVELDRLDRSGEVRHAEHDLVLKASHVRQHLAVASGQKLDRAAPEHGRLFPQANHLLHPVQQRVR